MRIQAGELEMHVQRLGPETPSAEPAPIVVLIHGLLTDSLASYYFTLGPAFAAAGVEVIMYDLRGHGRTTRLANGYQLEHFVNDVAELLDALDIDRPVHLVGNSFGGSIAFGVAATHPERVASVIAIEAEPPLAVWTERMAVAMSDAKRALVMDEVIDWIAEHEGAHTARLSRAAGRILASTTMAEDIPRSATIDADLSAVRCPVFGLFGDESVLAEQAPPLRAKIEHCETVVLPEQGHSVLVERTEETCALILDWVWRLARTPVEVC